MYVYFCVCALRAHIPCMCTHTWQIKLFLILILIHLPSPVPMPALSFNHTLVATGRFGIPNKQQLIWQKNFLSQCQLTVFLLELPATSCDFHQWNWWQLNQLHNCRGWLGCCCLWRQRDVAESSRNNLVHPESRIILSDYYFQGQEWNFRLD